MDLRRAAIFGGTFDPVHNGHMEAARRVRHLFALEEVIFVPACAPQDKRNGGITSACQRFAMLALATEDDARLCRSRIGVGGRDRPYALCNVARIQGAFGPE